MQTYRLPQFEFRQLESSGFFSRQDGERIERDFIRRSGCRCLAPKCCESGGTCRFRFQVQEVPGPDIKHPVRTGCWKSKLSLKAM